MSIDFQQYADNIESWYKDDEFYEIRTIQNFCKILEKAKLSGEQFNIIFLKMVKFFQTEDIVLALKHTNTREKISCNDVYLILDTFFEIFNSEIFASMKKIIQTQIETKPPSKYSKTEDIFWNIYEILDNATKDGDSNTLKQSVDEGYCDIKNSFGENLIFAAANKNNLVLIQSLQKNGAKIDITNKSNETILHKFCQNGNLDGVKFAIKYNSINSETTLNWAPLHFAASNNHANICEFLCNQRSIKKNPENINNETPLDLAISKNNTESIKVLKKYGCTNKQDTDSDKSANEDIIPSDLNVPSRVISPRKQIPEHSRRSANMISDKPVSIPRRSANSEKPIQIPRRSANMISNKPVSITNESSKPTSYKSFAIQRKVFYDGDSSPLVFDSTD